MSGGTTREKTITVTQDTASPASADTGTTEPDLPTAADLQSLLDGPHAALREATRQRLLASTSAARTDSRATTTATWSCGGSRSSAATARAPGPSPRSTAVRTTRPAGIATFQTLGHGDLSLMVKMGVQFGLFGGAVHRLGTEKHHRAYLRDLGTARTCPAASR